MNKKTREKIIEIAIILLIVTLLYVLYRNIEGHQVEDGHEHTSHGSCDCNPDWYKFGKCHTEDHRPGLPSIWRNFTTDRNNHIRNFCRSRENETECNNTYS